MTEDRFPLGEPTNRPATPPELKPNPQRGIGWHVDREGRNIYREPPRPKQPAPAKTVVLRLAVDAEEALQRLADISAELGLYH